MTAKADAARIPRPLVIGSLGLMGFVIVVDGHWPERGDRPLAHAADQEPSEPSI